MNQGGGKINTGEHEGMDMDDDQVKKENILENNPVKTSVTYQCPMDCEHDKTYDNPGSCPVCKMDLQKVKISNNTESKTEHNH